MTVDIFSYPLGIAAVVSGCMLKNTSKPSQFVRSHHAITVAKPFYQLVVLRARVEGSERKISEEKEIYELIMNGLALASTRLIRQRGARTCEHRGRH